MQNAIIIKDAAGKLYTHIPVKRIIDWKGRIITRHTTRRCDESGTPLKRLRLPKKLKLKLRRAGIPATKWIQSRPTE